MQTAAASQGSSSLKQQNEWQQRLESIDQTCLAEFTVAALRHGIDLRAEGQRRGPAVVFYAFVARLLHIPHRIGLRVDAGIVCRCHIVVINELFFA